MSADQVDLSPNWPGIPAGNVKRVDPEALNKAADRLEQEARFLQDKAGFGTPGYLAERTKVTDELAPTWQTAHEVTNAFNNASGLIVSYYRELAKQMANAAATLRVTAARYANTEQSNAKSFDNIPPSSDQSAM